MTNLRQSRWLLSGMVSLTLLGWALASNHCGLSGLFFAAAKSEHSCCHSTALPAPAHSSQCCDSLSAPIPGTTIAPGVVCGDLLAVPAVVLLIAPVDLPLPSRQVNSSSGPPGFSYFTSIVLKRSMPSHAPPLFAA